MRTSREYSLHVFLDVEGEVVRPGKGPLTHLALVWPDPGVFPGVAAELVRSGELPAAALPGAHVGLLPRVRPQVGLHVRGLMVHLAAVLVGAVVDHRGLLDGPPPPLGDGWGGAGGGGAKNGARAGGAQVQPHWLVSQWWGGGHPRDSRVHVRVQILRAVRGVMGGGVGSMVAGCAGITVIVVWALLQILLLDIRW